MKPSRRSLFILLTSILLFAWIFPADTAFAVPTLNTASATPDIAWFDISLRLAGGLALFLLGLDMLSEGLKKLAGESLKLVLSKLTSNRFMAAITGAFVTGVINSSSVTTVLVVGFVTAGAMSLSQSVGVIMGANIGSTLTAQLLAFDLAHTAILAISIGFFLQFANITKRYRYHGTLILGFGLIFFGMGMMSEAVNPLRSYEPLISVLESMKNPLLGIITGALFTALVQSSAATVGIAIALASGGLLSLPAGIALALGANIGTCVTALLAAIGKPVPAIRAAVVHVMFNIIGVLIWLPFIDVLSTIAITISPVSENLSATAAIAADLPRQIANANTLFNLVNTLLFIGFTGLFAKLATLMVPDRPERRDLIITPLYLDNTALDVPTMALENARKEFARAGKIITDMLPQIRLSFQDKMPFHLDVTRRMAMQVRVLEDQILAYLSRIREKPLSEKESRQSQTLMTSIVQLNSIAELIALQLTEIAQRNLTLKHEPSEKTHEIFRTLYKLTLDSLDCAIRAVAQNDQQAASEVLMYKEQFHQLSEKLLARKSEKLAAASAEYLQVVEIQISLLDQLRHIYTLAKRMAKEVLEESLPAEEQKYEY